MTSYRERWEEFKKSAAAGAEHGRKMHEERAAAAGPDPEMPYVTYNWLLFKCFDACIKDLDNKMIDVAESKCVEECGQHLWETAEVFQRGQMFKGFQPEEEAP